MEPEKEPSGSRLGERDWFGEEPRAKPVRKICGLRQPLQISVGPTLVQKGIY
jgi:hypothetical protein